MRWTGWDGIQVAVAQWTEGPVRLPLDRESESRPDLETCWERSEGIRPVDWTSSHMLEATNLIGMSHHTSVAERFMDDANCRFAETAWCMAAGSARPGIHGVTVDRGTFGLPDPDRRLGD